jgi:glucose-1-phosphate cytidylyltransferase
VKESTAFECMSSNSQVADSKFSCVFLCGGQSLRMRFELPNTNKILAVVADKPLVHHILDHYHASGLFDQLILCLGNDSEMIRSSIEGSDSFSGGYWKGTKVLMLDTGADSTATFRIREALKHISDVDFFVSYTDVIGNVDHANMLLKHRESNRDVTMALARARMPYGRVIMDNEDRVYDFIEKPVLDDWINAGSFVINRRCLVDVDTNLEFESEFLPRIVREGKKFFGYRHNGFWKGVDTYKDLVSLRAEWENIKESNYY